MKKSTKVLLYFGLDCGMLEFFTQSKEQFAEEITISRRFEHMQTMIQSSRRLDSFLLEAA
jgi:hypothetical protein